MFYKRIKELRIECNLTQQQVAEILEMKQEQYQRYESGKREIPLHLIIKLANLYDVSIDYIVGRSESKSSEDKCIG